MEELIRQMTTYRVEEFEDEDEDIEAVDFQNLSEEKTAELSTEHHKEKQEQSADRAEVIEPKIAKTAIPKQDKPVEVSVDKVVFKTKCQHMQEEIEKGNSFYVIIFILFIF